MLLVEPAGAKDLLLFFLRQSRCNCSTIFVLFFLVIACHLFLKQENIYIKRPLGKKILKAAVYQKICLKKLKAPIYPTKKRT